MQTVVALVIHHPCESQLDIPQWCHKIYTTMHTVALLDKLGEAKGQNPIHGEHHT